MICIYVIENTTTGHKYVGKTKNFASRKYSHFYSMRRGSLNNRHLLSAYKKHGEKSFKMYPVEKFEVLDEHKMGKRELFWMDHYNSCDREFGYNLRRDTSTGMVVHEETKRLMSERQRGDMNCNFGNRWSDDMKSDMSKSTKHRHASGRYSDDWRAKISKAATAHWADPKNREIVSKSVSVAKQIYFFDQFTREGVFLKRWESVADILETHPNYKWQNIYASAGGYKPTYMGFVWAKVLKNDT